MMSCLRHLFVVAAVALGPPVRADDKPPAKPDDARRAALVEAGYVAVPLELDPRSLLFYVNGTVGTEKVKFLLDSGFEHGMIDDKVADRLKLERGQEYPQFGLGGRYVGRQVKMPGLVLGPYDFGQDATVFCALAADLSAQGHKEGGVLGRDVLDQWAAVIDYPAATLYLRSPLKTAWPRLAGKWAITSWREDGAARPLDPKAPSTFTFADSRVRMVYDGVTEEYAIHLSRRDDGTYLMALFDPKEDGKPEYRSVGLVKLDGGAMTACLLVDPDKAQTAPTEFAAPKGSGYALLELKHIDPDTVKPPADPLRDLLVKYGYTAVRLDRGADGERLASARAGKHDLRLMVNTGTSVSVFDAAGLGKWGARLLGAADA